MKVLKEGNWHAKWELKVSCVTCGAELLAEEIDLKSYWDYVTKATKHCVACPLCKKEVVIPAETLTKRLAEKLHKYEPSSGD